MKHLFAINHFVFPLSLILLGLGGDAYAQSATQFSDRSSQSSLGVELVAPPSFYAADRWQGRSQAVIRVLDRRDSEVALFTLSVGGEAAHYKSLSIRAVSCLQRPNGLPQDSAVNLDLEDKIVTAASGSVYDGWFFAKEPSLNGYVSPLYAVSVVGCGGNDVAPFLPPLVKQPVPHLTLMNIPQVEADNSLLTNSKSNEEGSKQVISQPTEPHYVPRETQHETHNDTQPLAPPLSSDGDDSLLPPLAQ